jgi:hypothetical protein
MRASTRGAARRARYQTRTRPRGPLCYIAVRPCGCVVEAIVIGDQPRAQLEHTIERWLDNGWRVGRTSVAEGRYALQLCPHDAPPPAPQDDLFTHSRTAP